MAEERGPDELEELEAPDRQTVAVEFREAVASGDAHASRGRYRSAIRVWEGILHRYEPFLDEGQRELVRRRIAAAYFERSQLSLKGSSPDRKSIGRGMARLEQALRWQPDNAECLYAMGRCHWLLGDAEKAQTWFRRATEVDPSDARSVYALALARLVLGHPEDTISLLESAERGKGAPAGAGFPNESSWTRLKVLATAASGQTESALRMLVGRPRGSPAARWAADAITIALSGSPSPGVCEALEEIRAELLKANELEEAARVGRLLGDMYQALGDDVKAVNAWIDAHGRRKGEPVQDITKVVSTCERRALSALLNRDFDEAEKWCVLCQSVQEGEPITRRLLAAAHDYRGIAEWRSGHADRAEEAWRRSLETMATLSASWNLALAKEQAGVWSEAADCWRVVTKLAEERGDRTLARAALRKASLASMRLGDLEQAGRSLRYALQLGDDPHDRKALAFLTIAAGRADEAIHILQGLLGEDADGEIYTGVAIACEVGKKPLQTRAEQWRRALSVTSDPVARAMWRSHTIALGMQAWKANDHQNAMRRFAELLLEDRFDVDGWIWCGALHLDLGREDRAKDCFDQALAAGGAGGAETFVKLGGRYLAAGRQQAANQLFGKALRASTSPRTHRFIAEVCFEAARPDMAYEHLREGIRRCTPGDAELFRLLRLAAMHLTDKGETLALCQEALAVTSEPSKVKLLVAAHYLRNQEWRNAQDVLEELAKKAEEEADQELHAEVETLFRALILPLTIGKADSAFDVDAHIARRLEVWAAAESGEPRAVDMSEKAWSERASHTALAILESSTRDYEIREPDIDLERPRLSIEPPRFGRELNLTELVARDRVI